MGYLKDSVAKAILKIEVLNLKCFKQVCNSNILCKVFYIKWYEKCSICNNFPLLIIKLSPLSRGFLPPRKFLEKSARGIE